MQFADTRPFEATRIGQWRIGLNLIFEKPWFGWGAAAFSILYPLRTGLSHGHSHNLDSLGLFIVSGLLASCFTKNMIVILAIAIFMGTCKTCTNYFSLGRVLEGMENEDEEEEEEEEEEDEEEEGFIGFREGFKEGNMAKKGNKKKSGKGKKGNKCTKVYSLKIC